MSENALKTLSDQAEEAHARIQQAHEHINPVIEVRSGMRKAGIPADVMTIDCLRTRRRIMLVVHDEEPGMLLHRFMMIDDDVDLDFQRMPLAEVGVQTLFDWMQNYFSADGADNPNH